MKEESSSVKTTAPKVQKIERVKTLEKEHKDALERAVSLNIPHAMASTSYLEQEKEEASSSSLSSGETAAVELENNKCKSEEPPGGGGGGGGKKTNWNDVVKKLFERDESGELVLQRNINSTVT